MSNVIPINSAAKQIKLSEMNESPSTLSLVTILLSKVERSLLDAGFRTVMIMPRGVKMNHDVLIRPSALDTHSANSINLFGERSVPHTRARWDLPDWTGYALLDGKSGKFFSKSGVSECAKANRIQLIRRRGNSWEVIPVDTCKQSNGPLTLKGNHDGNLD